MVTDGDGTQVPSDNVQSTEIELLQEIAGHEEYQSTLMTVTIGILIIVWLFYRLVVRNMYRAL